MIDRDLMPPRRQPPMVYLVLALLLVGGGLFVFLHKGRQVSGQATQAVVTQAERNRQMRQVDPALVKWREVRQVSVMSDANCIAVAPDGELYHVSEGSLHANKIGVPIYRTSLIEFALTCLAVGSDIYLGGRDRISVRGKDFKRNGLWPVPGERVVLSGLAPSRDGLWVADSGNRRILHLDKSGTITGTFGKGQLIVPSPHLKVLVKPDGNLLVNNPGRLRVDTFSPTGVLKSSFGKASVDIDGFCGCCNPVDIALLPDGRVVTAEKGLPRVKVYSSDGMLESVVVGPEGLSPRCVPQIAVTPQGQILVLDPPARAVRVFERNQ
ncbi:MAG: NHL repeat-containing protein [Armatimonadota bacterium]